MSDIDTSPEAVEAMAQSCDDWDMSWLTECAALLRQLAKERDEAYWKGYEAGKTEGQQLARLNGHCDAAVHEARNAALSEAIEALKGRIVSDEQDAIAVLEGLKTTT